MTDFDVTNSKTWYALLKFGLFRDYRIVRMADAQGNKRDGIFIPFVQNGIRWSGPGDRCPTQYLKPSFCSYGNGRLLRLRPFVSEAFKRKMIDEGVLSPDDKYPCDPIGYIVRDKDKM